MDNKKKYMISTDSYLYQTILNFTSDIDKIYKIFTVLHSQEFWTINQIESLL